MPITPDCEMYLIFHQVHSGLHSERGGYCAVMSMEICILLLC